MKSQMRDMIQALESVGVSLEQYRACMDGGIYVRYEDVPMMYRTRLEKGERGTGTYDYVGMLERGKAWVIDSLREYQPRSFRAFEEVAGPLSLGIVLVKDLMRPEGPPLIHPIMFFDVSGRMIEVHPAFPGDTYEDGNDSFGTLLTIPDGLARSWLWRTLGWRVPGEAFEGPLVNRQLISHPGIGNWLDTDVYLDSLGRGWKKRYLNTIVETFPDIKTNINGVRRYKFSCFLDTRPSGTGGPLGDQFFVCSTRQDRIVYHIHQGDIDNIRILRDPEDAIDRYCAHVLRRHPGEFDFSPWSEPMR